MTQENGLPEVAIDFDTIGAHNWCKPDTWIVSTEDSTWTLEPEENQALVLHACRVTFDSEAIIHDGGALTIDFFMDGNPDSVKTIVYESVEDFFDKAIHTDHHLVNGKSWWEVIIPLAQKVILWSTAGTYVENGVTRPKLNKMTLKIADHQSYKQEDGTTPGRFGRSRYYAAIYADQIE